MGFTSDQYNLLREIYDRVGLMTSTLQELREIYQRTPELQSTLTAKHVEPKQMENLDHPLEHYVEQLVGKPTTKASADFWTSEVSIARQSSMVKRIPADRWYLKAMKNLRVKKLPIKQRYHKARKKT